MSIIIRPTCKIITLIITVTAAAYITELLLLLVLLLLLLLLLLRLIIIIIIAIIIHLNSVLYFNVPTQKLHQPITESGNKREYIQRKGTHTNTHSLTQYNIQHLKLKYLSNNNNNNNNNNKWHN
jgi:ABC-type bacteriocin/lantibiotic exporter with double-glycine peptidase domain